MKPAELDDLELREGEECRIVTQRPFPDDDTEEVVGAYHDVMSFGDGDAESHTPMFYVGGRNLSDLRPIPLASIVSIDRVLPRD
jgi:hypothetical protein